MLRSLFGSQAFSADRRPGGMLLLSEIFPPQVGGSANYFWHVYRGQPTANVTIVADPSLFNDGTDTDDPSENVNVPPVT